jgi:hypothetical protein
MSVLPELLSTLATNPYFRHVLLYPGKNFSMWPIANCCFYCKKFLILKRKSSLICFKSGLNFLCGLIQCSCNNNIRLFNIYNITRIMSHIKNLSGFYPIKLWTVCEPSSAGFGLFGVGTVAAAGRGVAKVRVKAITVHFSCTNSVLHF